MEVSTAIVISKANSLRFVKEDGLLPSFDNTFSDDWGNPIGKKHGYCQILKVDEAVLIQIRSGVSAAVVLKWWDYDLETWTTLTADETTTHDDFKTYDYLFTPTSEVRGYFKATSEDTEYNSEPFQALKDVSEYKKVEWFNLDETSQNNNFFFDYSTTTAKENVNFCYLEAYIGDYKPTGELEVFDNQDEKLKIKESVGRMFTFKSGFIPAYLAEILIIAQAHDYFIVNDVQYTVENKPKVDNNDSNLLVLSIDVEETNVLGINTDDIGFDCDGETDLKIMNIEKLNATGNFTLAVTAGYLLHSVTAVWNSGTGINLKVGITAGGSELAEIYIGETAEGAGLSEVETMTINRDYASGMATIYFTLTGSSPNISVYGITIKNRLT